MPCLTVKVIVPSLTVAEEGDVADTVAVRVTLVSPNDADLFVTLVAVLAGVTLRLPFTKLKV